MESVLWFLRAVGAQWANIALNCPSLRNGSKKISNAIRGTVSPDTSSHHPEGYGPAGRTRRNAQRLS